MGSLSEHAVSIYGRGLILGGQVSLRPIGLESSVDVMLPESRCLIAMTETFVENQFQRIDSKLIN